MRLGVRISSVFPEGIYISIYLLPIGLLLIYNLYFCRLITEA